MREVLAVSRSRTASIQTAPHRHVDNVNVRPVKRQHDLYATAKTYDISSEEMAAHADVNAKYEKKGPAK